MKILYYSAHPTISLKAQTGPGTHMREMINAMTELGHEVYPVIMADKFYEGGSVMHTPVKGNLKSLVKKMIPGIVWRSFKEYKLQSYDKLAEQILKLEIDSFQPDLVYERGAYMQISGINAVKDKKCYHYMEINAPFFEEVNHFENAPTVWKNKAIHYEYLQSTSPDKVYVVSNELKKYYLKRSENNEKIEIIPNCVNLARAVCNETLKISLMEKLGLKNKSVIGFVGSVFPYHGVDLLIRSFATLASLEPDAVLLIVGDGETMEQMKELRDKLGLEDRIIFTGSITHEDVFTYIDLMDITVLVNSNWYGSPIKIFEYGAMKKPIVAPFTGPVMEVMRTGVDALLTPANEQSVCNAMQSLITDKNLSKRLGEAFHQKVNLLYTWKSAAQTILGSVS